MTEQRNVRVSDRERQAAADRLRAAHDEGRLGFAEYDDRLAQAYASVTYADLARLFADLPPVPRLPDPRQAFGYGYLPGLPVPGPPAHFGIPRWSGPVGQVRSTGVQMLLFLVTFGFWALVYHFQTHDEMRRHSGRGLGGVVALLVAFFVSFASPFLLSSEVGDLYERSGRSRPVSALTGLWVLPGFLLLVGPIVWFVKTNGALNAYWRSLGAR